MFNKICTKFALFKQAFDEYFERLHEHEATLASLPTDRFHLVGQPDNGFIRAEVYDAFEGVRYPVRR